MQNRITLVRLTLIGMMSLAALAGLMVTTGSISLSAEATPSQTCEAYQACLVGCLDSGCECECSEPIGVSCPVEVQIFCP